MRIAAIDIGGTAIKYGLSDEFGNITNTGERPTEAMPKSPKVPLLAALNIFSSSNLTMFLRSN